MSNKEELKELIRYWFEKSRESLDAARDELKAGRLSFSVNRIYYSFLCGQRNLASRKTSV